MDGLVATAGDGNIEIALAWPTQWSKGTGAEATRGCLRVSLRGESVWHGADDSAGFEWTWIELLEFLSQSWLFLALEDGTPFGVALDTAPRMLAAAETAIGSDSPLAPGTALDQLEAYRMTHDLAEAVQGAVMPPLWIVKDDNFGWVASTASTARVPFGELLDLLGRVGDSIASRLSEVFDDRSREAVHAWHIRHRAP